MHYRFSNIYSLPTDELVEHLKKLSPQVTSLDLSENSFYQTTSHDVVRVLKAIPKT